MVLVDSSAWIESFRAEGDAELTRKVADLVAEGRAAVAGIIKLELLSGARGHEVDRLQKNLSLMPLVPTQEDHYEAAGRLGSELRRAGISIPASDLLIATIAVDLDIPLLHCDRHFDRIAQHRPLRFDRDSP